MNFDKPNVIMKKVKFKGRQNKMKSKNEKQNSSKSTSGKKTHTNESPCCEKVHTENLIDDDVYVFDGKRVKIEDAPILEFDEDESTVTKEKFFNQGKKEFWKFEAIKKLKIDKCLIYLPRAFDLLTEINCKCELVYEFKSASTISPVYLYNKKFLIALCPLGGPAATNLIEELHFVGIKTFVALGSCGCLDNRLGTGTLIVPTQAIRDEGVSYHYLPPSRDVETSKKVNAAIATELKKNNIEYVFGKVWTIDAIYRETPNRIARRHKEGAIAVEMECASMAAVAKHKKISFGQLLYISDTIEGNDWKLRRYDRISLRTSLVKVCINVLKNL